MSALYAWTTGLGRPGPATNSPAAAGGAALLAGAAGVVLGALIDGVAAVESGGVVALALEVGVDEVDPVLELEPLPICVSMKKPTTTTRTPMTPIWTIGLSLMAFLMRSPGAAAESKKAPTRRRRPA